MNLILFDDKFTDHLLPLTFTRPASELRTGILTITRKWELALGMDASHLTRLYLSVLYPLRLESENLFVNGRVLPDENIITAIGSLVRGEVLMDQDRVVAFVSPHSWDAGELPAGLSKRDISVRFVDRPYDLFLYAGEEIERDFEVLTSGRKSEELSSSNRVTGPGRIFLEPGARVEGAILNPDGGSIYIGNDAEIMEGSVVRGPLALCTHSTLKLSSKIYGPTTIGPYSKVGGEVNNSVILGYSNKGHDGFLGNSVLGEWCNIGADSNNSNLKNNYAEVKLWDYPSGRFAATGLQFCGLIMGDHSKCGINTMFNTGTVVGVSANIFGSGFPRNFVPSFAWGGSSGFTTYSLNKAMETAELVMQRRQMELTPELFEMMQHIFNETAGNRFWEKK